MPSGKNKTFARVPLPTTELSLVKVTYSVLPEPTTTGSGLGEPLVCSRRRAVAVLPSYTLM
jgi:hypothetical protein